jgi:hypothetical protein
VRRWIAIFGTLAAANLAAADEVSWQAAVPLWKSLGSDGRVVAAGPAPSWLGEEREPCAKLGPPSRPAPDGLPRPRELPDNLGGPTLPNVIPTSRTEPARPTKRPRELFAIERDRK